MAKRKEEKITPEGIRKAMELDQDKINAALAGAVSYADGRPQPNQQTVGVQETNIGSEANAAIEPKAHEPQDSEEASPIDKATEEFGRKCFNLDITAQLCNQQSSMNKDKSIDEFLRGINRKIYDEVRAGGYSTNIQFMVAPNDYVNISHITDWYKARGFQILNFNQSTPPYGRNAGNIQYNFTISWAEA